MDKADQLGRYWPCPRCGNHEFSAVLSFERGFTDEEDTYIHFYPPAAYPVDVEMDDVKCTQCRLRFSLEEEYALDDGPEWGVLELECDCDDDECECEPDSDPEPETQEEARPEIEP